MEGTTSRLRKTFRYPADENDSEEPSAMDEQEQETLIKNLRQQNDSLNKTYSHILLALPLVSTLPYLVALFQPNNPSPIPLLSFLSITSLLSTAYLVYILPPEVTGLPLLDAFNRAPPRSRQERLSLGGSQDGPIRYYLPLLNVGLCVVLLGLGKLANTKRLENVDGAGNREWWVLGSLPAGVYGVVLLGKWVMGGVDPERELGDLRYEFKGA